MQALGLIWGDVDPFARDFEEVCTLLPEPAHFGARLLFNHWREKQEKGGFQLGRDLPSRELSTTLRNLIVYEPTNGCVDFRVRLAGSALLRRFGRDVTGLSMSDLFDGEGFEPRRRKMAKVVQDGRHYSVDVMLRKKRSNGFEILGLPVLSETGARWALAGIFYHDWAG